MSTGFGSASLLQALLVIAVVGAAYVPLGDYMARVYSRSNHLRVESVIYRLGGIDPDLEQKWTHYLAALLAFSMTSVLALFALLRLQSYLPLSEGHQGVPAALAFNTAVSFTTNTSWQNYAGEATLGHLALATGLGVAAFTSAAVGMAAGVALVRSLARHETDRVGNFWVDLIRGSVCILLPLSILFAIVLIALGVVQNLQGPQDVATLVGGHQSILGGPVSSWESIKLLSGDGGGAFNANSAHPFENPNPLSNVLQIAMMLLIPVAFIRLFGKIVGSHRQGWALLAVATALFLVGTAATTTAQYVGHNTATVAAGGSQEGTETRFGVAGSSLFGATATATADGAANASYSSFSSLGGAVLMANMMLGEVSPGGAGSGLYALLMVTLLAAFLGGLMIGRTPGYLHKRLRAREMKLIALYIVVAPVVILAGTGLAAALPAGRASIGNPGPHGLSEILYAFVSSTNGNGSAFASLAGDTGFYNTALALAMLLGRYLPMILVLALAGSFAAQRPVVAYGSLRTDSALFVTLVIVVTLIVVGLEFFPVLALGPLAEGLR
jgi:potassium-transporting ATPase potassium-binding subunit